MLQQMAEDGENHIRVGRLNLVDLAGSERQSKTQSQVIILFHYKNFRKFKNFCDVLIVQKSRWDRSEKIMKTSILSCDSIIC